MTKAQQLLLERRAEIEAEIKAQTAPLQAEIEAIDRAIAAMQPTPPPVRVRRRPELEAPTSINGQALAVLEDAPMGLETAEVAHGIREDFERDVTAQNLSWYLSHLKKGGKITQVGKRWILPRHLEKTKAAG